MGKPAEPPYGRTIPEVSDRHANRLAIVKVGEKFHVNFRNLQIRLSQDEFDEWRKGLRAAVDKLGDRMRDDIT